MLSDKAAPRSEPVIACDTSALTQDEMQHWMNDIVPQVYKAVQEIQELPDGYAFRLPARPEILMLVAEDLNMERQCCPFVRYTLDIEPNRGPFWLRMTGSEEVKAFMRIMFESASLFDEQVARAAGFNTSTGMDSLATVLETIDTVNAQFADSGSGRD
jgi:hypothetical protein